MNQIIMEGNIGKDPELKWSGEMAIAKFSLAHTPRKKDKSNAWSDGETIWFNVTFFGSKAESVIDNYVKGETVLIVGAFEISNYEKDFSRQASQERGSSMVKANLHLLGKS
jgi:single-strand DNA-binding protein